MQQAPYTKDEAEIRTLVAQVQQGWNSHDGHAFAAPFAEDADYVIVDGQYVSGRTTIANGHQYIFDTIYRESHNTGAVQHIRFLRDDVAIVHVQWHLQVSQGPFMGEHQAMATMTMTREGGRWSIAAFQNTPIVPRGA